MYSTFSADNAEDLQMRGKCGSLLGTQIKIKSNPMACGNDICPQYDMTVPKSLFTYISIVSTAAPIINLRQQGWSL